jgi:hypothetical protein
MSEKIDLSKCISIVRPNGIFELNGDEYEGLKWLSKDSKPTEAELIAVWGQAKEKMQQEINDKVNAKNALLEKLGITEDEARLLLA